MKNLKKWRAAKRLQAGFTLIELLVVVLIIGILAAIAVPQYFKVVEKGKAAEALAFLDAARGAQDRYLANTGGYCTTAAFACAGFDMTLPTMKYFTLAAPTAGTGTPSWKTTLTRGAPAPTAYGAYTVLFEVEPGVAPKFTCATVPVTTPSTCQNDLMPQ